MNTPQLSGRTGLLGGTFNPVHLGHLHIAQEAMTAFEMERVLLVPNRIPPHRSDSSSVVDPEHRAAMLELATASNPRLFVSRIELERAGPSYTVDTVESLLAEQPAARLCFITGADSLLRNIWRDLDRLLGMLEVMVCVARPGFDLGALCGRLDELGLKNRERVRTLEAEPYAVSSTEIRRRVAEGLSTQYLVPREVADYIEKYGLYKNGGMR